MHVLFAVATTILGICLGSFLNVVIYRVPRKQQFWKLRQRSRCPRCRHQLHGADLVPVVSYLALHGKCRYCHKPISSQYAIVEVMTGATFLLLFLLYGASWTFLTGAVGACFLIVLGWIDGLTQTVPDRVSLPGIVIVALLQVISVAAQHSSPETILHNLAPYALGTVAGAAWFWLQWVLSRGKWVGSGDIRYGALLGVYLGLGQTAVAVFTAYILGSAWAIRLLLRKRVKLGSRIAFGTFLSIGGVLAFIFGPSVVSWYQHLIGW